LCGTVWQNASALAARPDHTKTISQANFAALVANVALYFTRFISGFIVGDAAIA
jgi:hypothetical protein